MDKIEQLIKLAESKLDVSRRHFLMEYYGVKTQLGLVQSLKNESNMIADYFYAPYFHLLKFTLGSAISHIVFNFENAKLGDWKKADKVAFKAWTEFDKEAEEIWLEIFKQEDDKKKGKK